MSDGRGDEQGGGRRRPGPDAAGDLGRADERQPDEPGQRARARTGRARRGRPDPAGAACPSRRGGPGEEQRHDPDRDVDVEDPAPGRREERRSTGVAEIRRRRARPPGGPSARIAAPRNGPAAIPRNVSAPMTPSARGRAGPLNRCAAAAVPTGTRTPPPTAWTSRAAMSWSSVWARPASAEPDREDRQRAEEQPPRAPQVRQPAGQRHRQDVDEQVAVDDPARLAQLDPGGAAARVGEVGEDRRQGDGRDHQLEAGQEHAGPEDGEQHERGPASMARECSRRLTSLTPRSP